jgi:hypothetical protein
MLVLFGWAVEMNIEVPQPWPDEILFSTISRAGRRLRYSTFQICRWLFAGRYLLVQPHFGSSLDYAATCLRERAGWKQSADRLRENNTLAPLVLPFLPQRLLRPCLAAVHQGPQSAHSLRRTLQITPFTVLRFCPQCREDDIKSRGEAYWHRIHQVPGLRVCCHHGNPLHETAVMAVTRNYAALDDERESRPIRLSPQVMKVQLQLGANLWATLNAPPVKFERRQFAHAYWGALVRRGVRVGMAKFMAMDLREFFGEEAITAAVSDCEKNLRRLLNRNECPPLPTPLLALLAARLEVSLGDLLNTAAATPALERPPWPCMNPNCSDHGKLVIFIKTRGRGLPPWRFRCPTCRVIYTRTDPLTRNPDGSFVYQVATRSPEWYAEFRRLWMVPELRWEDLEKPLGLGRARIRTLAAQLGLPSMKGRSAGLRTRRMAVHVDGLMEAQQRSNRGEWLNLRALPALDGAQEARLAELTAYMRVYDRKWLVGRGVEISRFDHVMSPPPADGAAIDDDWCKRAMTLAPSAMKTLQATWPYRIYYRTLVRQIEETIRRRLPVKSSIPKTVAYLESLLESSHDARERCRPLKIARLKLSLSGDEAGLGM